MVGFGKSGVIFFYFGFYWFVFVWDYRLGVFFDGGGNFVFWMGMVGVFCVVSWFNWFGNLDWVCDCYCFVRFMVLVCCIGDILDFIGGVVWC